MQDSLTQETFVGIDAAATAGISKLTIDYGSVANFEQIDELIIEYPTRPSFSTYLAQIADGPFPTGSLQTTIVVSNLSNTTATGSLRLLNKEGQPLSFEMNGTPGSTFSLSIPPLSSKSFASSGNTTPATPGYACIDSNVPLEGTAIYRILDTQGRVSSEAGVGSVGGRFTIVGVVQRSTTGDFNSGVAVANTSNQNATGTIFLYDESGTLVASNTTDLLLGPGQHRARFLHELFAGLPADFRGSILVTSDQPLALVILRTTAGLVISSLPVGSTQE